MKLVSQAKKITYKKGGLGWKLNLVYEFSNGDRRYVDFEIDAKWTDGYDFPTALYPECLTNFRACEAEWDWDVLPCGSFVRKTKTKLKSNLSIDYVGEENKAMMHAVRLFDRVFKFADLCK